MFSLLGGAKLQVTCGSETDVVIPARAANASAFDICEVIVNSSPNNPTAIFTLVPLTESMAFFLAMKVSCCLLAFCI